MNQSDMVGALRQHEEDRARRGITTLMILVGVMAALAIGWVMLSPFAFIMALCGAVMVCGSVRMIRRRRRA